jgi:uncharacterized protein involved in exopolysaccharide biosynthesis
MNEVNYQNSEKTLIDVLIKIRGLLKVIYSKKIKIFLFSFLFGVVGFVYVLMKDITYTAKITFLVEDTKSSSSLSNLASLAGQFGVDVGNSGPGGVIASDNIINYLKSESLSREVLLSKIEDNKSFATKYIEVHGLKDKWSKNKKIGNIQFPIDNKATIYSRLQDSLLNIIIVDNILKKQLSINKIDKKSGFIQIILTTQSEAFSKKYCDKLLEIAVKRYINIKTSRQQKTVNNLQYRLDSIINILNNKTSASAKLQTVSSTMDMNPLYKTNISVLTESTLREKTMLSTVYVEVIKNLELAKFTLNQETPVIQIIDEQRYPLKVNKSSKLIHSILFSGIAFFFSIIIIILWYYLKPHIMILKKEFHKSNL